MVGMKIGAMAFLVGIIAAVLIGLGDITGMYTLEGNVATVVGAIILLAGLVVGFMNVSNAESVPFVVGVVALTLLVGLISSPIVGGVDVSDMLQKIAQPIITFLAPAAIVVAGTVVINKAKN